MAVDPVGGHAGAMWTCPQCGRTFANRHQWHSCIQLSLSAVLAGASEQSAELYRRFEAAVAACGPFRIHPQKTRIAFISTMTFASARLARRWVDISLITSEPIDDPRIRGLDCYGPTSFGHTLRIAEPGELDADVRAWLCAARRRGARETLDPAAHVQPLVGRPLELVRVPLRCVASRADDTVALAVPRYAAEVFQLHPAVVARLAGQQIPGVVAWSAEGPRLLLDTARAGDQGIADGDAVDVFLRADL